LTTVPLPKTIYFHLYELFTLRFLVFSRKHLTFLEISFIIKTVKKIRRKSKMAELTLDEFIEEIRKDYWPFGDNEAIGSPNTRKEYNINSTAGGYRSSFQSLLKRIDITVLNLWKKPWSLSEKKRRNKT